MPNSSSDRQQNLITLFLLAANLMTEELVTRLAAAGYADLRPSHGRVFENLDRNGTRLTELAERARMTHQSMSELVDSLEKAGYVERRTDPVDARAKLICLTPRGRQMLRVAVTEVALLEEAMFGRSRRLARPAALRRTLQSAIETHLAGPHAAGRLKDISNAPANTRSS